MSRVVRLNTICIQSLSLLRAQGCPWGSADVFHTDFLWKSLWLKCVQALLDELEVML